MRKALLLIAALFGAAALSTAEVRLPAVLGDNMVLQRNTEVKLWGWSTPRKKVKIKTSWNHKKYRTRSDEEGRYARTGSGG